jgi:hypothetical protein
MRDRSAETSPKVYARTAGFLYLIIVVGASFAQFFVRPALIVHGDAAATAANILASESLYRLGGVTDLSAFVCDVAVALIFYELFKPVSRSLALLAAFFRLTHAAIVAVSVVNHFAPLLFLGGADYLEAFEPNQLQALALASTRLHETGYTIALVFFGFHCLLIGYLLYRSTFFPRLLGVLLAIAGACYLANSFLALLAPAVQARLFPWVMLPAFGEPLLVLWLVVIGVNVSKWNEKANAWRSGAA